MKPAQSGYYRQLTDLITLFWAYHTARLDAGTLAMAYDANNDYAPYQNPEATLGISKDLLLQTGAPILRDYGKAVLGVLELSWESFVDLVTSRTGEPTTSGVSRLHADLQSHFPKAGQEVDAFRDPYIANLIHIAEMTTEGKRGMTLTANIQGGLETGVGVTVGVKNVVQEHFRPTMALLVSRIAFNGLRQIRADLRSNPAMPTAEAENHFINPTSPTGLDVGKLLELGYQKAEGCPAGQLPTDATRNWLIEHGFTVDRPMLLDFSARLSAHYDKTIGEWWQSLPEVRRNEVGHQISVECTDALTGRMREALHEHRLADAALEAGEAQREVKFKPTMK